MAEIEGRVLKIVVPDGKHGYELIEKHLKHILIDHPKVNGKKVAVLSVAGECRMAKSFLLNFLLRYLATDDDNKVDWLNVNVPLTKLFNYRASTKMDTKGILAWSEPILVRDPETGKKLALILMDTQGSFDNEPSRGETATIFALSTMVSSILIYNISSKQLNSNHLENLQYFAKYGKLAMDSANGADEKMPAFQSLLFLVRDWQNSEEMPYGFGGSKHFLDKHLTSKENDTTVMRKFWADIPDKLFQSVRCFLMPGNMRAIDKDSRKQMGMLVPGIFDDLSAKSINGQALTGQELFAYFTTYFGVFKGGEMPIPKSVFEATAEASHQIAKDHAVEFYTKEMENDIDWHEREPLNESDLAKLSTEFKEAAVKKFIEAKKLGDAGLTDKYRQELCQEIQQIYEELIERNNRLKKIAHQNRTEKERIVDFFQEQLAEWRGPKEMGKTELLKYGPGAEDKAIEHFFNTTQLDDDEAKKYSIELRDEIKYKYGKGRIPWYTLAGRIEFKEVHFAYLSRPGQTVLRGLNLEIGAGQIVAICGPSGAVKNTIAAIIQRLFEPKSGQVLLDGFNLRALDGEWLCQSVIDVISQEPVIFSASIRTNICGWSELMKVVARFGNPAQLIELQMKEELANAAPIIEWKIKKAAKLANAAEFIERLSRGYDTLVGENGVTLSMSQKQRIAIARALVKNTQIIFLLDEATSSLDNETEKLVIKALSREMGKRTVIIISNRLTTIQNANQIYVLKDGQVAEVEATAEAKHQIAKADALELYIKLMEKEIMENPKALDEVELEELSSMNKESAIEQFKQAKKFGDAELTDQYCTALHQEMQRIYEKLVEANKWKAEQNEAEEKERKLEAEIAKIYGELDELKKDKEANGENIAEKKEELKMTEEKAAKAASETEKIRSKLDGIRSELKCEIEKEFFEIAGKKVVKKIAEAPKKIGGVNDLDGSVKEKNIFK